MKRLKHFTTFLIIPLAVLLISCGGTRNDEMLIDETGFPSEPPAESGADVTSTNPSDEEAEVLRLLGIEKEESAQAEEQATPTITEEAAKKVTELEEQLSQKDVEIANLKAQLAERERRLQNLQKQKAQMATASPSVPTVRTGDSFKAKYQEALALYNSRRYNEALALFDELLSMNVNNSLVDNCQYWKGECYYALRDYNQAILEFQKVFMYSDSNKLDDAQLKLGLCYIRLGDKQRARTELEKLLTNYPDSEYVERAQRYLDQL